MSKNFENLIGKRVGCILEADEKVIKFLGFGTYVGDEIPDANTGGFGSLLHANKIPNPKIVLDNDKVVFGCECWWGSMEQVKEQLSGERKVVWVDIDEVRKNR